VGLRAQRGPLAGAVVAAGIAHAHILVSRDAHVTGPQQEQTSDQRIAEAPESCLTPSNTSPP
jgi:hypothetical protein